MKRLTYSLLLFILLASTIADANNHVPVWRYTIRPGDTLITFSSKYLVRPADWAKLQHLNQIINPRRLIPGQTLRVPLHLLKQRFAPAEVLSVTGHVTVSLPNMAVDSLRVGEKLAIGTKLQSDADSSATLLFADGTTAVIQPNSTLQLDTLSVYEGGGMVDTKLRLQKGRTEIKANPKHQSNNRVEVTTPSALAVVRGTHFRVATEGSTTLEETLTGRVGLITETKEVPVTGGYGSIVELGMPARTPVTLLTAPDLQALPNKFEHLPLRFEFAAQANAVGWVGQIAPDTLFNQVLLEKISDTPQLAFADLPDGQYQLRVRAKDTLGLQGVDAVHAFELNARPFAPILATPSNNAAIRTSQPELSWTESEGIQNYHIQLARDIHFSDLVLNISVSQTYLKVAQELTPGDYYLHIASISGEDQGPYSDTIKFTYKPVPSAPDLTQSEISFDDNLMYINLPVPHEGSQYEVQLLSNTTQDKVLWRGKSTDGQLEIPRSEAGKQRLSIRIVDIDGNTGPFATQIIDVPRKGHLEGLLLLIPLLVF